MRRSSPSRLLVAFALFSGTLSFQGCGDNSTAPALPAGRLVDVHSDGQTADVGTAIFAVVQLVDTHGNPISDVQVSFSVTQGNGSVAPATVTTDLTGRAATTWTLGPSEGINKLTVRVTGVQADLIMLTATGRSPSFFAISVAAGAYHSCAITRAHEAFCWGDNSHGQLGDSTTTTSARPVRVAGHHLFSTITAGQDHSCALDMDGVAYCWGGNSFGQLGTNSSDSVAAPVAVATGLRFTRILTESVHTCALSTARLLYCWGANIWGQLGTGGSQSNWAYVPTAVAGNHVFSDFAVGWRHTCGVTPDYALFCWGANEFGAVGDSTTVDRFVPTAVHTTVPFTSLGAGYDITCGVAVDEHGYCWGDNNTGGGGTGTRGDTLFVPTRIPGSYLFRQFGAGMEYTCGVSDRLLCWGSNSAATLGNGETSNTPTPALTTVALPVGSATKVVGSMIHTCAIAFDSALYCWGLNQRGEVGDGTMDIRRSPVRVLAPPAAR